MLSTAHRQELITIKTTDSQEKRQQPYCYSRALCPGANVMQNEEKEYHLNTIRVRNKSGKSVVINIELLLDFVSSRSCDVIYLFIYLFISCERTNNKRPVHSFSKFSYPLTFHF